MGYPIDTHPSALRLDWQFETLSLLKDFFYSKLNWHTTRRIICTSIIIQRKQDLPLCTPDLSFIPDYNVFSKDQETMLDI